MENFMHGDQKAAEAAKSDDKTSDRPLTQVQHTSKTMACSPCRRALASNLLVILTLVAVVLGFVLGLAIRESNPSGDAIMWIGIPGEVYLRMLKMVILPLIVCSVITGTAALDPRCNGKVSMISIIYIIISNSVSIVIPLVATLIIRPGDGVQVSHKSPANGTRAIMETPDVFADLIRNLFPPNIVAACFEQTQTMYSISEWTEETNSTGSNGTSTLMNVTRKVMVRNVGTVQSTNALGIVICCLVFGMASASLGERSKAFYDFFHSANEVIIKVLGWFVWVTPAGVASLIAVACLKMTNLGLTIQSLGLFALIVLCCLIVHQLFLVPLAIFILLRTNPFRFLIKLGRPWMVSFAAASSAMAMPETLEALEGLVDRRISRFVVPFASTINRDGSCIFIAVATIFVSQLSGEDMDAGKIFLLWMLTTVVSMATPSVPSASLVTIILILTTIGVSSDMVGLLFASEWILDRLRAGSNCLSHAHCSLVTNHFCRDNLLQSNDLKRTQEENVLVSRCDHGVHNMGSSGVDSSKMNNSVL